MLRDRANRSLQIVALAVTMASFAPISLAWAQSPPAAAAEMVPLTDDLSREELFSRFVAPKGQARALAKVFAFPADTQFEAPGKPRTDAVFGIDISHHNESRCNCQIDWTSIRAQSVAFVYLKATQGDRFFDTTFARHWGAIGKLPKDQSLYRGAYHFLASNVDAAAQARHFLRVLPKLGPADMAPCLDLEWDMRKTADGGLVDTWAGVPKADIAERALAWLRQVKAATGKTPIIYTNRAWWNERIGAERAAAFAEFPIWIADYSSGNRAIETPGVMTGTQWALWQFTEDARLTINGKLSKVDANIYKGSLLTLKQKLGIVE